MSNRLSVNRFIRNIVQTPDYTCCPLNTTHVLCHCCNEAMPQRLEPEMAARQQCAVCRTQYCRQYFGCSTACPDCLMPLKGELLVDFNWQSSVIDVQCSMTFYSQLKSRTYLCLWIISLSFLLSLFRQQPQWTDSIRFDQSERLRVSCSSRLSPWQEHLLASVDDFMRRKLYLSSILHANLSVHATHTGISRVSQLQPSPFSGLCVSLQGRYWPQRFARWSANPPQLPLGQELSDTAQATPCPVSVWVSWWSLSDSCVFYKREKVIVQAIPLVKLFNLLFSQVCCRHILFR